eukprot:1159994-Pelagomonas_calceolata.AAC.7
MQVWASSLYAHFLRCPEKVRLSHHGRPARGCHPAFRKRACAWDSAKDGCMLSRKISTRQALHAKYRRSLAGGQHTKVTRAGTWRTRALMLKLKGSKPSVLSRSTMVTSCHTQGPVRSHILQPMPSAPIFLIRCATLPQENA